MKHLTSTSFSSNQTLCKAEPDIGCPHPCPSPPMLMGFGWAWVWYYCSWVGMATILLGMGGHAFNIVVHEWAWAKAKQIGRGHGMSSHSMLSRVRALNHLRPVRWVHPSVYLLPVRFWVRSWVYRALKIMLLCEEHIILTSSSILSLLEQSLVCSVQKSELHALHTKHCSCYSYGISIWSISLYTIVDYMGAIWMAWVGTCDAMCGHAWTWVQFKRKISGSDAK